VERPFQAYEGDEPYVFVCYAHEDKALVYPDITRLKDARLNIWYDEGISPGSEWSDTLARHIEGCAVFLYYVTPRSVVSEHCRREANFALQQTCGMLAVHLEPTDLPSGLKLTLSNRQAILKYDEPAAAYEAKLAAAIRDAERDDVQESSTSTLTLGDWALDVGSQRLTRGDESHALDPKALSVLVHLIDRAPEVVSRQGLIERTWPDVVVGDNVLDQAVAQLRRVLGDDARHPTYIETLPKRGYRLVASLKGPASPARPASEGRAVDRGDSADRRAGAGARSPQPWWIAAAAVAVIALGIAIGFNRTEESPVPDLSIAVLPLSAIGSDPAVGTVAVAMTEELRTAMTAYRELRSVSATGATSPRDVIDASYAVGGNVQRLRERVRLRVSLTRTRDAETVWSDTFDRPWAEARADPEELPHTVGRFVRLQLWSDQECERVRRTTRSEQAAHALCAANAEGFRAAQIGDGDHRAVLTNAQRAAALDPDVPLSYELIATSYVELASLGLMDWKTAAREAHAALDRGLALTPDPRLLAIRARVQQLELDYAEAKATLESMLTDPKADSAPIHVDLAVLAMARGDLPAALDHYRQVLRNVDTIGPWYQGFAAALLCDGQYRDAIEMAETGLPLVEVGIARYYLYAIKGLAHEALSETEAAGVAFAQALASVEPTWKAAAAFPLVRLGRVDEARALLARMEATENPQVMHMVHGYAQLNRTKAFEWIHEAIERHVLAIITFLRVNPTYSELRTDPRWNEVMAHLEAEEAKGAAGRSGSS
jgi:DNA-binding winged helix-turn-helix (wHTH) protein/TolB-like protein/tetratricopeptide (TPR) repeat protein